jgi:glycosyltransferase involved in cell wall biosynthesis
MKFSILIPTYNRADLIGEAIGSALAQCYANREIIVVDDGSTDRTQQVVAEFGSAVRYVRQANRGKAAAINTGISASQGEIVIVLDDDDAFPTWALSKHATALQANPSAAFSYGRFERFYGSAPPNHDKFEEGAPYPADDPRRLVVKLMENCFIPNPGWAVRRSTQLSVGPYDETLVRCQDYDMILRLSRRYEGTFIDDIVFYQRKHEAFRGPESERVLAVDAIEKWIKYDAVLFRRLNTEWPLEDFRPFDGVFRNQTDRCLAFLQKGVILFRRKVYQGAAQAFATYRTMLGERRPSAIELKIASGLLGSRYGIDDLLSRNSAQNDAVQLFTSARWPISMRMALGSQLRWRIREAIKAGNITLALKLLILLRHMFGLTVMVALGFRHRASSPRWVDLQQQQPQVT